MLYWYFYTLIAIITESFPISSSGHVALFNRIAEHFMQLPSQDFISAFDHLLHGPIAVCVALFFYPRWRFLLHPWRARKIIFKLLVLGFITESITTLFYVLLLKVSLTFFPVSLGFLITAILLYSLRFCSKKSLRSFDFFTALILGCVQAAALLPGISRFGSTFVVARWLGFSGKKSFELSFLLLMPLATAGFLKGLKLVYYDTAHTQLLNPKMLLVMMGASGGFYLGLILVNILTERNKLWYVSLYVLLIALLTACI